MVQMIFARREPFFEGGLSSGVLARAFNDSPGRRKSAVSVVIPSQAGKSLPPALTRWGRDASTPNEFAFAISFCAQHDRDFYGFALLIAVSSFPSMARGNSSALNSAPTSTISEMRYIHTSSAIDAPSDP